MTSLILGYIMPLLAYLFVFTLTYALLAKTKILGEDSLIHFILSIIVAILFIFAPMATKFTALTIPWVVIFIFVVFFMLLIITFVRGNIDDIVKSSVISIIFAAILLIIFTVSAINVFGPLVTQGYLSSEGHSALYFFMNPQFIGLIVLLVIAGIISWRVIQD